MMLQMPYTRILEVELDMLDNLSVPFFKLVIKRTIKILRVLVVAPRIPDARQQCSSEDVWTKEGAYLILSSRSSLCSTA